MYSIQRTSLNECTNLASNGEELKFPVMWRSKKIGEILKMSIGSTPPKKGDNYNGDIPWVTISNLTTKDIKQYTAKVRPLKTIKKLPAGSLVGSFKMSVGRFGFLSEPSATNEAIIAIPPDATKENLMFLYYALPSVFKKNATLNGQGVPLLNTETIKKLDVILPPLEEQTAIANILSDQETLVAHYNDLIALHEKRFAYLSDELLSGRLRLKRNEENELVFFENTATLDKLLNGEWTEMPSDWMAVPFKYFGGFRTGKDHKLSPGNSYPVYGSSSTRMSMLTADYLYEHDTFIIGRKGTIDRPYRVRGPFWCVDTAMYFVPMSPERNTNFLYYQSCRIPWTRYNTGSTMPSLNQSLVNSLEILVAPPDEQEFIVKVLSDQEALITEYKKLRDAEQKRFDWLSDALLSGTYRVKMEA